MCEAVPPVQRQPCSRVMTWWLWSGDKTIEAPAEAVTAEVARWCVTWEMDSAATLGAVAAAVNTMEAASAKTVLVAHEGADDPALWLGQR